jgi:LysR family transcriptional regulator, transcription activator of glutamate synthase operon
VPRVDDFAHFGDVRSIVPGEYCSDFSQLSRSTELWQALLQGPVSGTRGATFAKLVPCGCNSGREGISGIHVLAPSVGAIRSLQVSSPTTHASNDSITYQPCTIIMCVDTDALRWFQQVADGITVTEVGEIERVTQSGVSRALARLEAEVGTPLLRRSGRTLRMTHAGTAFKRHVDRLLHELDDGLSAVDQLVDPETGTVTLAFHLSLGTWLVPDLVSSFRAKHPGVQFDLRQLRDEVVTSVPRGSQVDLEITTVPPIDSTMEWRSLLVEPLRLAVPSAHRLAASSAVRLADVSADPFVALRPTSLLRQVGDDLCKTAGFAPTIAFEGDDVPTVRGFVGAGLGIAIVPAVRDGSADAAIGTVRQLHITDARAVRNIGIAWSTERRLLPTAELFRKHVLERATARLLPNLAEGQ